MPVTVNNNYEVTVTPEYWLTKLKNSLPQKLRKDLYGENGIFRIFAKIPIYNAEIKSVLKGEKDKYEVESDYIQNASERLYQIYKEAESPTIHIEKPWYFIGIEPGRAFYDPITNSVNNIKSYRDLTAELAHPILLKYGLKKPYNWNNIKDTVKAFMDKKADTARYSNPESYEYETHEVFLPLIHNYIVRGIIPNWLK